MATDHDRRRLDALATLGRVSEMDTRRLAADTAALRDSYARLEQDRAALLARLAGESQTPGIEGAAYLGQFIRSIRAEVDRLTREMRAMEPQVRRAEDQLREALLQQKTYDILHLTRSAALRKAQSRKAARQADALSLQRWTRREIPRE